MSVAKRALLGFFAAILMIAGVSTVAWAADEDLAPSAVITLVPSPTYSSGLNWGVAVDANDNIYTSRIADGEIQVFAKGANGSATPLLTIPGLDEPTLFSIGADNRLYIGTITSGPTAHVYIYSLDGTRLADISGAATTFGEPLDAGVDDAGNIYILDSADSAVKVFAPGSTGDVAPIRTIVGPSTGLDNIYGFFVNGDGSVWVANRNIAHQSLDFWSAGASGNVPPSRTIFGALTQLEYPHDVAVTRTGEIVASNESSPGSVVYFSASASGDVSPIRRIVGPATELNSPMGIAFDSCGALYVANYNARVNVYGDRCVPASPAPALAKTGVTFSPLMGVGIGIITVGLALMSVIALRRNPASK